MSTQVQFRRGTTAESDAFTGAAGEVTVDTTKKTLRVHDGATVGGSELALAADVAALGNGAIVSPQGRLTMTSNVADPSADIAGATGVYYMPVSGDFVPIFDGVAFRTRSIGSALVLPFDNDPAHQGYQQAGRNYDLFAFDDAGTIRLGTGPAWTAGGGSDTARGVGDGSTELENFSGRLVNKVAIALRYGLGVADRLVVPVRQATYLGSMRAIADGQGNDTKDKRFLFNAFNRVPRPLLKQNAAATYTYSSQAWRQAEGNATNQVEVLLGLAGISVEAESVSIAQASAAAEGFFFSGIGVDSAIEPAADALRGWGLAHSGQYSSATAKYRGYPGMGHHTLVNLEFGNASGVTFLGYGQSPLSGSGIAGSVFA